MKKPNGSGQDGDHGGDSHEDPKIARFPTPGERREIERLKTGTEKAARAANRPKSEPVLNLPPVVKALSGVLLLVHLAMEFMPDGWKEIVYQYAAFVPARYTGGMEFGAGAIVSPAGHMFLHGGWLHLAINLGTLMAFGAALEKTIGGRKLLVLFFVTGILGAFAHAAIYPREVAPLVGASGGISGLFGAVLVMAQDRGMMEGGIRRLLPFVGIWILISLFFGYFGMPGAEGQIAWTVHIAGFIAGLLLYRPVDRMKI